MRLNACEMARRMYMQDFGGQGSQRIFEETRKLPKFKLEEITKGPLLGTGGVGMVYEVSQFDISLGESLSAKDLERTESPSLYDQEIVACHQSAIEGRKFITEHCHRRHKETDEARYAIKTLRSDISSDQMDLCQALADLNVETRILSSIDHPNIIKLRAIGTGPRFHQNYFLVLDRLYDTLEARMKTWRHEKNHYHGLSGKLRDPSHSKLLTLWHDRLLAGYNLSSAVAYLHDHRIIHRDLKPQNIGFDVRNEIKLFDFGLAKELPNPNQADSLGRYCMSICGSYRYMAPEVALMEPYNETCDVYSLAIVLWEMLTLRYAYEKYTNDSDMMRHVYCEPYKRPFIKDTWPTSLQDIFNQSWHPSLQSRPSVQEVEKCLKAQLIEISSTCIEVIDHPRNRSFPFFHKDSKSSSRLLCSTSTSHLQKPVACFHAIREEPIKRISMN